MRIHAFMGELKRKIVISMTKPRMVITARSFYSRADMKLYLKKRTALSIFLAVVNVYVWSVVICQTIPTVQHALASESITLVRGASFNSDIVPEQGDDIHGGSVSADPYSESEEGANRADALEAAPSEDSIVDCKTAAAVYSRRYEVNENLLGRIIEAESGNKNTAASGKSTARGCFQFIFGTWELYGKRHWGEEFYVKNVYSPKDNVDLASWAISQYGTSDWDASKHIWAK